MPEASTSTLDARLHPAVTVSCGPGQQKASVPPRDRFCPGRREAPRPTGDLERLAAKRSRGHGAAAGRLGAASVRLGPRPRNSPPDYAAVPHHLCPPGPRHCSPPHPTTCLPRGQRARPTLPSEGPSWPGTPVLPCGGRAHTCSDTGGRREAAALGRACAAPSVPGHGARARRPRRGSAPGVRAQEPGRRYRGRFPRRPAFRPGPTEQKARPLADSPCPSRS